jgi:hypothetical protein
MKGNVDVLVKCVYVNVGVFKFGNISDIGIVRKNVKRVLFPVLRQLVNYFRSRIKCICLERYIHFYSNFLIRSVNRFEFTTEDFGII